MMRIPSRGLTNRYPSSLSGLARCHAKPEGLMDDRVSSSPVLKGEAHTDKI